MTLKLQLVSRISLYSPILVGSSSFIYRRFCTIYQIFIPRRKCSIYRHTQSLVVTEVHTPRSVHVCSPSFSQFKIESQNIIETMPHVLFHTTIHTSRNNSCITSIRILKWRGRPSTKRIIKHSLASTGIFTDWFFRYSKRIAITVSHFQPISNIRFNSCVDIKTTIIVHIFHKIQNTRLIYITYGY